MMADGWIKIHRNLQQHWIYKDPVKLKWWIDILLTVNYIDAKINIGNELFECKRGQSIMSLQSWADRWKTSKDNARNFLKLLAKDSMILHESIGKSTRITVCNYDTYQSDLHDTPTQHQRKTNATQTQPHPKEEYKEREERKEEEGTPDFIAFNSWLKKNHPNVSKLKTQMTNEQMDYLIATYGKDRLFDIIAQMENKKDLNKKYVSVYLTANNWLKR